MADPTGDITIAQVEAGDIDSLLHLYIDLFHDREPLTKWIGFSRERMTAMARAMHATHPAGRPPPGKHCWMARTGAAGSKSVGFIVCDDPAVEGSPSLPEDLTEQEQDKLSAIMALLEEIRRPAQDWMTSGAGHCLHVAAIGVAPGFEGKGIAKRLLHIAISDAEQRGVRVVFSECTSRASLVLHEKMGFKCLKTVSANTLPVNGRYPFTGSDLELSLAVKLLDKSAGQ